MIGDAAGGWSEAEALEDSPEGEAQRRGGLEWRGDAAAVGAWGGGGRASETALDEGVAE